MTYDHWKTTEPDLDANTPHPAAATAQGEPSKRAEALSEAFCNLTVAAAMRCSTIVGAAHALYYYHEDCPERCASQLEQIRFALNDLTKDVVAAEAAFSGATP